MTQASSEGHESLQVTNNPLFQVRVLNELQCQIVFIGSDSEFVSCTLVIVANLPNLASFVRMDMKRREYAIDIFFNDKAITKVVIDPHYEQKHAASITDRLILQLVGGLDGMAYIPEIVRSPYAYFSDEIERNGKNYRLVWLLEENQSYIGVINAYRR